MIGQARYPRKGCEETNDPFDLFQAAPVDTQPLLLMSLT